MSLAGSLPQPLSPLFPASDGTGQRVVAKQWASVAISSASRFQFVCHRCVFLGPFHGCSCAEASSRAGKLATKRGAAGKYVRSCTKQEIINDPRKVCRPHYNSPNSWRDAGSEGCPSQPATHQWSQGSLAGLGEGGGRGSTGTQRRMYEDGIATVTPGQGGDSSWLSNCHRFMAN